MIQARIVQDSISRGGIRLTTIEATVTMRGFEKIVRPRALSYSFPYEITTVTRLPSAERRVLLTASKWQTVLDYWLECGVRDVMDLALACGSALKNSTPTKLDFGEWHLPYINEHDIDAAIEQIVKDSPTLEFALAGLHDKALSALTLVSVARCATMGGERNCHPCESFNRDLQLYSTLSENSRTSVREFTEHLGTPDDTTDVKWLNAPLHGNLVGWIQYTQVHAWEEWRDRAVVETQARK